MAKYPQQHLQISLFPMAVLAMDSIDHMQVTSRGHQWALTAICMHTSYMFAIAMEENHLKCCASLPMRDIQNSKTLHSTRHVTNSAGKEYFQTHSTPKSCQEENVHNFIKRSLTKFLESSDLEWDELLPFACYYYTIFSRGKWNQTTIFLMFGHQPVGG